MKESEENKDGEIHQCVDLDSVFEDQMFTTFHTMQEHPDCLEGEVCKAVLSENPEAEKRLRKAKDNKDYEELLLAPDEEWDAINRVSLAIALMKMWGNGRTLRIRFLGGNDYLRRKVARYSKVWELHANLKFKIVATGEAEIRVSFMQGKGSWSYVGTDCLRITDQNQPTMNFGWFNNSTPEAEFSRTIIHEFGHAIGCVHEHSCPAAKIPWNKPAVYAYYWRTQRWSKEQVDHNLFAKFDQSEISNSMYDKRSIMHYPIDNRLTIGDFSVGWNTELSQTDKTFVGKNYPK